MLGVLDLDEPVVLGDSLAAGGTVFIRDVADIWAGPISWYGKIPLARAELLDKVLGGPLIGQIGLFQASLCNDAVAGEGGNGVEEPERRIELSAEPFPHDDCLQQQRQLRGQDKVVVPHDTEDLAE